MKFPTLSIISTILIATSLLIADSPQKYSQIRIFVPDRMTLDRIWNSGIDFEGSSGKIGGWMEFTVGPYERAQLQVHGIPFSVIEDDISKRYAQGITKGPINALGFGYGSMGGYYTYEEVKNQLDSMKLLYPDLVATKDSIGETIEGRAIWVVKISDNPDQNEYDEPEALYTALTHAREPQGMMTVIYYMWWLLENYGIDSTATYLVNNRQMWFIPVVNPDGYVYNQTTNPIGGGMWRKNRRNNVSSFGVDLNRNYGPQYMWDSPYGGSSTSPSSETYRGTSPFSEPEVYAISDFMWGHTVMTCLNYHTYGNYLIYPWGFQPFETDDSIAFREFAFDMTADNRYLSGTDIQTVNYVTRGNSDDFMYGGTMTRTFAMTPEVSTSGFWPPTNEILPLAMENLSANIYLSSVAGQYTVLKSYNIIDPDGNGNLEPDESFTLSTKIRNKGLADGTNMQVSISSNSPNIQFTSSTMNLSLMPARTDSTLNFSGIVQPDHNMNTPIEIYVTISDADSYHHKDTISLIVGRQFIVFADSATSGMANWNTLGSWGTTTKAHTSPYAFTDSPTGNYSPDADDALTLSTQLNLSIYQYARLKFWTKWEIEPTFDFATVEVSTDEGATWITLRSRLSRYGSNRGEQSSSDTWGYDGYTPCAEWIEQEADLTPYLHHNISLRFRLAADGGEQRDGWYLDDIRIIGYREPSPALYVSDNGSGTQILTFDEFPSATEGIDEEFGEEELLPKPGTGNFDVRWSIQGTNGTHMNFKDTLGIDRASNTFIAELQPGTGGYPFTIRWNPKYLPAGGWKIRDNATHGTIFNINMWTDTSLNISDESIQAIEIIHTQKDSLEMHVAEGWNMASIPGIVDDRSKAIVFPSAISDAFGYDHTYGVATTLEYHSGYWLKFASPETLRIVGVPLTEDTIQIPDGWWMISGLSYPLPLSNIQCSTPPCNVWKYVGHYRSDTTISPGEGFWVKGPKQLILSCYTPLSSEYQKAVDIKILNSLNRLKVTEQTGLATTLYFGIDDGSKISLSNYELPPAPPSGSFDARFSSQRFVETFTAESDYREQTKLLFQSEAYPLTIEWNTSENTSGIHFEITDDERNNQIGTNSLTHSGSIVIHDPRINSLVLRKKLDTHLPKEFSISQNFPNPFNPITTIGFGVPSTSIISLKIYNALGQEIQTLIKDKIYLPGGYNIAFDGMHLPSGLYFYRFDAISTNTDIYYQKIIKMVLLK